MSQALTTVQNAYAAFGRGDVPALLALLSPDVVWQFIGDRKAAYSGTVRGHGQVAEWLGQVAAQDGIQAFEPREFLVGPDHVTVIGFERTQALPGGRLFESEWVHVWQLREGRISRFLGILDTEAAGLARP
ncbi:nuclear transport factor 2 family protein [Aquabacterium sp.]|uniref:nuclear transport factor 2 family protein n=1 Tax=Aquabacterium sp. TaxID=1872578 RepID=UPI0037832354